MIPTLRLVWLATLGVPMTLLALLGGRGLVLAAAYDVLLLVAVVADRAAAQDPSRLDVSRELPLRWVQGRRARVRLALSWNGGRAARLLIREMPPVAFSVDRVLFRARTPARRRLAIDYEAVPRERGVHAFGPVAVRARGPLGLIDRQRLLEVPATARVFPDLVSLTPRETIGGRMTFPGLRRAGFKGEGREFHQLRDYVEGDDIRQMDWKAFAHRGRPTIREYRAERNQRVMLLVDAGRLMTVRVADRLRFDWAVQAAGRLARAALAMGDHVGLVVFSRIVKAQLPAGRGPGHLGRLSDILCEADADLDEPDLGAVLHGLLRRNPRRTLVMVFTEIADPRSAEQVLRYVGALAPRHLGVVVTLSDTDLEAEREIPIIDSESMFRRAAAEELWQEYRRTETALQRRGADVVRARADSLAAETVERYGEIKRLGLL